MLKARQRPGNHRPLKTRLAQEISHQHGHLVALPASRTRMHPLKQRAKRSRELPSLRI